MRILSVSMAIYFFHYKRATSWFMGNLFYIITDTTATV